MKILNNIPLLIILLASHKGFATIQIEYEESSVQVISNSRHDTSLKLPELIKLNEKNKPNRKKQIHLEKKTVPNFLEEHNNKTSKRSNEKFTITDKMKQIFLGTPMPPTIVSVDGIGKNDAQSSIAFPPDTNGDVGIDYYVQYINTNWAIFDKTTGTRFGDVMQGNVFWAGFGGVCEQDNAGDPIVLFDKHAEVWVFTQFGSFSSADDGNGGYQCFAISDRADLLDPSVTFNRYEYQFIGSINDYPHLGIWNDASGIRSGYYMVTHDFSLPVSTASFVQASFSVFERDAMIAGNTARFLRFTDTQAFGNGSYGALPAHLESIELPEPGMCAPFINNDRTNDNPNSAYYVLWQLCVDWAMVENSFLSFPIKLTSNIPFSYDVNSILQPSPAPVGSELSSLTGLTMYKASARAYPSASGMPVELVVNTTVNSGNNIAGIAWAHLSLPDNFSAVDIIYRHGFESNSSQNPIQPLIIQQGLHAPDTDSRWVGTIALDQSGNIGMAYTTSGENTFPSVRYTGRQADDPLGQLRTEASCVAGGGVQTAVSNSGRAGRWGDYSSMSIDPVDQCTFWSSVEYVAVTGLTNWENRICSFRFQNCGDPDFTLRTTSPTSLEVCTDDDDPLISLEVFSFAGFNSPVSLSAIGLQGSAAILFDNNPVTSFPSSISATLSNLETAGTNHMQFSINANSTSPVISRNLDFDVLISNSTASAVILQLPIDNAIDTSVYPVLEWELNANATLYTVEIAEDINFNNIIESIETITNTYTISTLLTPLTQYYWRVTTNNNCGIGITSILSTFTTGTPGTCPSGTNDAIVFTDDVEGDVSGWTFSFGTGNNVTADTWVQTSTVHVNSGTNSFAAITPENKDADFVVSDEYLISPEITLPDSSQSPITLSYWNFQNMYSFSTTTRCDDAGILEISTDGGASFSKIGNNQLETDQYNRVTDNDLSLTSIPNTLAWCAYSGIPEYGPQEAVSVVNLDGFAGQTVRFRFRFSADPIPPDFNDLEGWFIDDITVKGCN